MAAAVLFGGIYAPNLSPLGMVSSDTVDRTLTLLPTGGATRAQKFVDIYAPNLSPLGTVFPDTVDRTLTVLPIGGATRAQKFVDTLAPQLGSMSRISAFSLTSNEPIVLTVGAAATPTQTWYQG